MWLQALHSENNMSKGALQFSSYLFEVGEDKLQVKEKKNITPCSSVKCFTDTSRKTNQSLLKFDQTPKTMARKENMLLPEIKTSNSNKSFKLLEV